MTTPTKLATPQTIFLTPRPHVATPSAVQMTTPPFRPSPHLAPPPGLLVAGIGRTPCGGGAWAGAEVIDPALEEVGGGAIPEAPPTWPQLREEVQRRLRGERIEAWVR